jgi:hypothetical protein
MKPNKDGEYRTEPARTLNHLMELSLTWRQHRDHLVRSCGYAVRDAIREMELGNHEHDARDR